MKFVMACCSFCRSCGVSAAVAVESFPKRIGIRALPIDEGSPTDVKILAMEEDVICGALGGLRIPEAAVSINTVAVEVLMTSTEGILVTTLVMVLLTSTVVMVSVSLINETAAESDGMRLWETINVDSRRLDGLDETAASLGEVNFSTRLAVD